MMNLPNLITLLRIFLTFIVIWGWGMDSALGNIVACAAFFLAATTDWLDGWIARKYNLVTNLGKLLDPLADKILITAGLFILTQAQVLPSWVGFLILFRELGVSGLRQVAAEQGVVIQADAWGKWKTVVQLLGVFLLMIHQAGLLHLPAPATTQPVIYALMVGVTIVSGGNYFYQNRHVFK